MSPVVRPILYSGRDGQGHRPSDKRQRGKNQNAEKCKLLGTMFQKPSIMTRFLFMI
jgi:hypothetical protein